MYQVKIGNEKPVVIDQQGNSVPQAKVHRIEFPRIRIDTPNGTIWEISGPATAEISVSGKGYTVPVA
jgi:hypothetical protein